MADHVVRGSGGRLLAGVLAAIAAAAASAGATLASFELNPAGPVGVALVSVVAGSLLVRRTHDPLLKGAAVGLLVGAAIAVLLWPLLQDI